MTDYIYGQLRPNWVSNTGFEAVSSNFEYITISTQVDIRTYAQNILAGSTVAVASASQNNLNKLLEIVSLRGQPVIMGGVTTANSGATFNIFLATEHAGGWFNVASPNRLIDRLVADGINYGFGANLSSVTTTTSTATVAANVVLVASTAGILDGDTFSGTGVTAGTSVIEVLNATSFIPSVPVTISSGVTLTFTPAAGTAAIDTPSTGTNGGLTVTFSSVLT